ncbi:MAG: AAA family ATPase [Dehalococcoidales bacterium]|nr:AAA family ATPase [Dehalococcoidales bacterium]
MAGAGDEMTTRGPRLRAIDGGEREDSPPPIAWPEDGPVWHVETGLGAVEARSSLAVMRDVDRAVLAGRLSRFQPMPTGFEILDKRLGGGFRQGELILLGGGQGVGKTTMAVQMARNLAEGGVTCLYVCYEHDEDDLLQRVIAMDSVEPDGESYPEGLRVRDIQTLLLDGRRLNGRGLLESLAADPHGESALRKLSGYADRLYLCKGSGVRTTLEALQALAQQSRPQEGGQMVLFIDYLQKVPLYPEPAEEAEKVTRVVEALKELALSEGIAVVALVAADKEGLRAKRLRLHHLRGSSALVYEADVILILNEKYNIVSKANIEFNPYRAQGYREWVICSIEKNRSARAEIDVEFRKRFEHSCFYPAGGDVQEQLIQERIYTE